ncbi:hypothetical protein PR048_024632 [Dryococelus australis]|uniref:Uncharacterized protein n=1 Tax=Dryococelus australis TaxID=614101 RepID=A0ABQ9GP31_9NEOP|nr:hypothetical protein PR048_024632 [Dryococelus australis]
MATYHVYESLERNIFQNCRNLVAENELFLCDETTDSKRRRVFAILFKVLTQQTIGVPEVVVTSNSFLDKADATSCAQAINNCVN